MALALAACGRTGPQTQNTHPVITAAAGSAPSSTTTTSITPTTALFSIPSTSAPATAPTTAPATTTTLDVEPPGLVVNSPVDGATVDSATVRFEGTTDPGAAVYAWDRWEATVTDAGSWWIVLIVNAGTNIARFTAVDAAGNETVVESTVRYAPPAVTATAVTTWLPSNIPTEHRAGSCAGASNITPRSDAYRCLTGNQIHDPCFVTSDGVVCDADPLTGAAGFLLDLVDPLPSGSAAPGPAPWILQLGDGLVCRAAGGATTAVDGVRAAFNCTDATWILADLRPGTVWSGHRVALAAEDPASVATDFGFVPISRIWQ